MSINNRGHGSLVGKIVIRFAKYASYCGLIFVDKRYTMKSTKIYTPRKFLHIWWYFWSTDQYQIHCSMTDRMVWFINAYIASRGGQLGNMPHDI